MMMVPLVVLVSLLAGSAHSKKALPTYMEGTLKFQSSDGFDGYMSALGVGFVTRGIACLLSPTATIKQDNNEQITIDTASTFTSTSTTFKLDTVFKEETADGRSVDTTAVLSGNKLIKTQRCNSPCITTIETREFVGSQMKLIHTIPSKPAVLSVRKYVK